MNLKIMMYIRESDVLGKITLVHRGDSKEEPLIFNDDLIDLSYRVSKEFRTCGYNLRVLFEKNIYLDYKKKLNIAQQKLREI